MPIKTPTVTFFHPPAVYDFRERPGFFGPISDVVPSSPIFEMYPVGLTSLADYLERHGYGTQIVNLAHKMLRDEDYSVESEIRRCRSSYVGIDLHWLPHAHGAIEIAKLVKEFHPDVPVILGGMSATYYHDELIEYPAVDYVIRGDSAEQPLVELVQALDGNGDLSSVPNLTYIDDDGAVVVNPLSWVPDSLDYTALPSYTYVIRSVMKYGGLQKVLPYQGWLESPVTMLLTSRGCSLNCVHCGGSNTCYRETFGRDRPAIRSAEKLADDVRSITSFSNGPIMVVNDIRIGGRETALTFLEYVEDIETSNEFVFELFWPGDREFYEAIDDAVSSWRLEFSPEGYSPTVRQHLGKFNGSLEEMETSMAEAYESGCESIDLFFLIGLPEQTPEEVLETVEYCDHLLDRFAGRTLKPFIAPLAPFLDPGSPGFENPEEYGYKTFCETFEDHRQQLLEPSWARILSYETEWMSREEIVAVTYEASRRLNEVKYKHGLIDEETFDSVNDRIEASETIVEEIERIAEKPPDQRELQLENLQEELVTDGSFSICGDNELETSWQNTGLKDAKTLAKLAVKIAATDLRQRMFG
ncbi:radical SAM domain protein [Halalkaliarchaeum desulfuricum]|uniref:Radical SAM domain protein n=1 Tax=Halalkaliarchaeum desulfuricum TaxID=2055893 RepID=A0A343TKB1_9EURY|nr:TIGR04190 family B12-binding domain/radical SAM domain protein [Halalkaliarchaeum desulfuricum]AUX09533.1 radical SAM domain protein [Halalkaliarchaeum desulfuricum]